MRTGGEVLIDCLVAQGVERIFSIPGESYLAVLDALYQSPIQNVVTRHESGAAMMAEAEGKMTGRPGVAFVTRGPGATNAAAGVHIAKQDSTPMVLFVGQIGRDMRGREAFQEVDYRQTFRDLAKWVEEIDRPERIPEILSHAWHVAMSGRPGPVVLALPEDMLRDHVKAVAGPRVDVADPAPTPARADEVEAALKGARSPFLVLGGSRWTADDVRNVQDFAERFGLPVGTTFRRQPCFPATHDHYAGDVGIGMNPALEARLTESDLLLVLGARFSEIPSQGFELLDIPKPAQTLVHVHPGPEELGRIYAPDIAVNATPGAFLAAMAGRPEQAPRGVAEARASYLGWTDKAPETVGSLQMGHVIAVLQDVLTDDAIITNGAGNYASWLHRFYRFSRSDTYLGPTSGSMGYGLPAGIAAKLRYPERTVVVLAGDGCFQMTSQEFGTACQWGANVVVLVVDNGSYGTIRMHQERDFPGRVSGTEIANPDFAALAAAYGGYGELVERDDAFEPAFRRALDAGRPAILHLKTEVEAITPSTTLSALRAAAST